MSMLDAVSTGFHAWMQARPEEPRIPYLADPKNPEMIPMEALANPKSAFPLVWRQAQSIARVLPKSLSQCLLNRFVVFKDPQQILGYSVIEDASYNEPCFDECSSILLYSCIALSAQSLEIIERLCEKPGFDIRTLLDRPITPFAMIHQPWIRQAEQWVDLKAVPQALTREQWMAARMEALFAAPDDTSFPEEAPASAPASVGVAAEPDEIVIDLSPTRSGAVDGLLRASPEADPAPEDSSEQIETDIAQILAALESGSDDASESAAPGAPADTGFIDRKENTSPEPSSAENSTAIISHVEKG